MSEQGLEVEEWDADFLNQVIQEEERTLSSQHPHPQPQPPPPFSFSCSQPFQQHLHQTQSNLTTKKHQQSNPISDITYSPPREFTQMMRTDAVDVHHSPPPPRSSSSSFAFPPSARPPTLDKDLQMSRLEKELGLVLEKLSHLEQECSELRKEIDKKDELLKYVASTNEKKDAIAMKSESTNMSRGGKKSGDTVLVNQEASGVSISSSDQAGSRIDIGVSTSNAKGVQTDETNSSALPNDDVHAYDDLSKKLLAIWASPNEQELGRNLISNLLMACQTDFHFLFGCFGMNRSSKLRMDKVGGDSSSIAALQYHLNMSHTPEAAKVSHFYSVLTKVKIGMEKLEALFQPLVNLCHLENVIVVQASLHILHVFLKQLLSLGRPFEQSNVMVEGLHCKNIVNPHGSEDASKGALFCESMDQTSYAVPLPHGKKLSYAKTRSMDGVWNNGIATLASHIDWVSLFEMILQIAIKNTEQGVRLEAVSIMNVIIMRSNAFIEREKFSQTLVFEVLSQLLGKEAGFEVRKQALQLLHLLLNCPKILVKFCSDYKEGKGAGSIDGNVGDASAYQTFCMILQGLVDCIACCGNGLEELKLCRNAVIFLAFLASSGKSGFEILVCHELFQDANFLMLVLQVLASEVDGEAADNADQARVFKERTLLVREALILLNRLVSNPAYSSTVLHLLTNNRDLASLTIDVANRLSRKDQICEKFDGMARQMRESEIVDLAQVYKKRVYAYLGDNIS